LIRGILNEPLIKHQQDTTTTEYSRHGICIIAFLLRTKTNYKVPLLPKVQESVEKLRQKLLDGDPSKILMAVHMCFVMLWANRWKPSDDNPMPCPTTRWVALHSLKIDGSLVEAKANTPDFAKITRLMRLCFLYQIRCSAVRNHNGDNQLALLEIQDWFREKVYSPFNDIRSLQHRATALAKKTPPLIKVWWTDREKWREMLYKGYRVHIDNLGRAFSDLEEATIRQWEDKVLMGVGLYVPIGDLADDLSSTNVGYSFVSDPRNKVFEDKDRLLRAILKTPELRSRFCIQSGDKGRWSLSKPALRAWLYEYSVFHRQMMTRAEFLAGNTRGTELTSMNHVNTRGRTNRNLCALGKYLSLMVTYTKMGSLTGHDRCLPHALDGVTSDLLLQDLAITRPFAQMAIAFCCPGDTALELLYRERLFVNFLKPFNSNDVSDEMNRWIVPIFGFKLGLRGYRDVNAAFQRKLCTNLRELAEGGEDQRVIAEQMSHSYTIHTNIYGGSADHLAGPAEDVLPLYLLASTDWQVECRVVPGKEDLPSTDKKSDALHLFQEGCSCLTRMPGPQPLMTLSDLGPSSQESSSGPCQECQQSMKTP
jgi:hypothetical protein